MWVVPLGLAVVGLAELVGGRPDGWGYAAVLEVVAAALLLAARRHALVAPTLAAAVLLQMPWIGPALNDVAAPILYCAVVGYLLGRWAHGNRGLLGIAVVLGVFWLTYHFVDERQHGVGDIIFVLTLIGPPYVLGRLVQRLADQKLLLEERQELVRREAVRDERDRIARELHDVIAHSVSAMVVQTAAAQDLVRTDPERAERMLDDVASTGRQALSETGRLLRVIRDDADELGLQPAPGLADLVQLVDRFRSDGLDVHLDVRGDVSSLPAGVDVSAYRIVQEALTNALRYAADRTAELSVTCGAAVVAIRVSNPANGETGAGSGLGLVGMAERVSLLGGSLSHGVGGDGRFRLDASLPVMTS